MKTIRYLLGAAALLFAASSALAQVSAANVSIRGRVVTNDPLIMGFVVKANAPNAAAGRVLVRVVGPGLNAFGVSGTIANPRFTIYNSSSQPIYGNDDHGAQSGIPGTPAITAAQLAADSNSVGAFALATGSRDAATVVSLQPGAYTVHAEGVEGAQGVALIEIYFLP